MSCFPIACFIFEYSLAGDAVALNNDNINQILMNIASTYRISKYPTLKLFRNGQMVKKEYRGQRSADALANFIREELRDPVIEHNALEELDELDTKKRHVLGYFENKNSENYRAFARVAGLLRDDCIFHAAFGSLQKKACLS
nr:hypothetical protein BaRGS_024684 [Batillaria attramentaria]